jgi:hypothetical protein
VWGLEVEFYLVLVAVAFNFCVCDLFVIISLCLLINICFYD